MAKKRSGVKPDSGLIQNKQGGPEICGRVAPGICGFSCLIRACRLNKKTVAIHIEESECQQIRTMSQRLTRITLKELFSPLTGNPVYTTAEASGCHASCVVPAAVLKTIEVAMEMALPREVRIQIDKCGENDL